MIALFYIAAIIAVIATVAVILQTNIVHGLLYLILSLLAVAVIFYVLGAPFAAVLEAILYAGAIMVLFVFVIMMLNLGTRGDIAEHILLRPGMWVFPSILCLILFIEMVYVLQGSERLLDGAVVGRLRKRLGSAAIVA